VYSAAYYLRWCAEAGVDPLTATTADVQGFVAAYRSHCSQNATIRRLESVKAYYWWLVATGQRPDNPAQPIRMKQPEIPPERPFTAAKLRRLVDASLTPRDRALVLVFVGSGARLNEVVNMAVSDMDWTHGTIRIREGKGGKQRLIAPGNRTMGAIRMYLDGRTDGPLWRSETTGRPLTAIGIDQALRRIGKRAGVEGTHAHRFRSTRAHFLYEDTRGDFLSVQLLLGHKKAKTTARYVEWGARDHALAQQRRHSLADRIA
jgi:integrase/recombinase XerC